MFLACLEDGMRRLRWLRRHAEGQPVGEELRGWSWDRPPVQPPLDGVHLGVSEIANRYCSTMRDIYLKYVEKVHRPPTVAMLEGRVYHEVASELPTLVKRILYAEGPCPGGRLLRYLLDEDAEARILGDIVRRCLAPAKPSEKETADILEKARRLWEFLAVQAAARIDAVLAKHPSISIDSLVAIAIPQTVERRVDAWELGLGGNLSIDALAQGNVVVELKTGRPQRFHALAIAGYALALECEIQLPIDYGLLYYVWVKDGPVPQLDIRPVYVDEERRREFLSLRDEAMNIIYHERDPGLPESCPRSCPYLDVCRARG